MYPVTIITARYGGAYEGGKYLAFNLYAEDVPSEITGDDLSCADWFDDHPYARNVGRGNTPDEAYDDLVKRMKP